MKKKSSPVISDKELSLSLSLEKFQELFKEDKKEESSKLKFLINDVSYQGKIENDAVLMNIKLTLESFVDEYQLINLFYSNSVIKDFNIPKGLHFGLFNDKNYLVLNQKGKFDLEFNIYIPYTSKNNSKSFKFYSISAGKLSFILPSKNIKLSMTNIDDIIYNETKDTTEVEAYLYKGAIDISWKERLVKADKSSVNKKTDTDKPEKEIKVEPIIYSEVKTSISVNETIIQCSSNIEYKVYKSGVDTFELEILGGKIVNIDGYLIKNYDIENTEDKSKITIFTNGVVYKDMDLTITYEKDVDLSKENKVFAIPVLKSIGVNREVGKISLSSSSNIELDIVKQSKLVKIDTSELPTEFKTDLSLGSLYAFKYFSVPYSINMQIIKHTELPVVVAMADYAVVTTVLLKEGKLLNQIDLKIRNNSQTFIKFFLPKNAVPLSAIVNRSSVKPVKGEDGSTMIPIDKSSDGEKIFKIKFMFNIENEKMDKSGELEIKLGYLDIPIKKLYWELYFPDTYKYKKFKGNLEKVGGFLYDNEIHSDLPLSINIPKLGKIYRFEDYFLNREDITLKFNYSEIFKLFKSNNVKPL